MRQYAALASVPVVLLVRDQSQVETADGASMGVAHVLTKPVRRGDWELAVNGVLSGQELPGAATQLNDVNGSDSGRTLRVLVVEDNTANQTVVGMMLKKMGHRFEIAADGREALQILGTDSAFDLVLMDCQMPQMNGYEATERVRRGDAGEAARRLPIVALTAYAMPGDRERCLAKGMNDYLTKPLRENRLREALRELGLDGSATGNATIAPEGDVLPAESAPSPASPVVAEASDETKPPSIPDGPSVDLIDPDFLNNLQGLETTEGEPLLNQLVATFRETEAEVRPEVDRLIRAEDWERVRALTHRFAGAAAAVGALKLRDHAVELERAAERCAAGESNPGMLSMAKSLASLSKAVIERYKELSL
jgi:CheY-like chemotaxis protein/HPt (histidine-containing phosphotransfer) domain-containing protein